MDQPRDRVGVALAFLLPLALYLATPAAVMNGDGFGYFNRALSANWLDKLSPGHLLYTPLLAGVGRAAQALGLSPVVVMRLLNQVAAATAVSVLFATAGRSGVNSLGRWLAAVGFAVSFGVWVQATDLEAYALPLLFVVATLYALTRFLETEQMRWAAAAGVCTALAALFHLATATLLTAGLAVLVVQRRSARAFVAFGLSTAVVFAVPVLIFGLLLLRLPSLGAVLAWLLHADHGYPIPVGLLSLPRAAFGFLRTFVVLDSFWSAPLFVTAAKCGGLLAAIGWLAWQCGRVSPALPPSLTRLLLAAAPFVVLQTFLGVWFFGSDSERWVFLAPLAWLLIAALIAALPARQQVVGIVGVVVLGLFNFTQGAWPLATDRSIEERVHALARQAPGPALLITPGHDWLRYFHLYEPARPDAEVFSLFLHAMRQPNDAAGLLAEVERRIHAAEREGQTVLLLRVLDPRENFHEDPWQMLAGFGLRPSETVRCFKRFEWETIALGDARQTVAFRLVTNPAPVGVATTFRNPEEQ